MKELGEDGKKWDFENIKKLIKQKKGLIKGKEMGFEGEKKDNERDEMIDYMRKM